MDLLQRLSFWQANSTVRMKTMVVEKEETIIEINQEQDEENRKATKTNIIIITETMLHLRTVNVSININLKHLLVFKCALFIFTSTITNVSQVGTHKLRYKVHQLLLLYSIISLHPPHSSLQVFIPFLFARDVWLITNKQEILSIIT